MPSTPLEAFCGVYKRVLSTRHFDSLEPAPDHNIIVCVDRVPEEGGGGGGGRPARRYRWSFGPAVESARTGYVVEVLDAAIPAESADLLAGLTPLRVHFQGRDCYGMYQPDIATLTVHLTGTTNATLVYAALDEDTMAVSITEVPPAGKRAAPVVQCGFMMRIMSE